MVRSGEAGGKQNGSASGSYGLPGRKGQTRHRFPAREMVHALSLAVIHFRALNLHFAPHPHRGHWPTRT